MTESASTPRLRATFAIYLALIAATAVVGPREIPAGCTTLGLAGFLFVAVAVLGRIWCSLFIAGHKDEVIVTTGPYALCRHPLYSFSVLGALGLGLTSRSSLLCLLVVVLIAALLIYAASCEEQFLADSFPEDLQVHGATPNKWLPQFGPRCRPRCWMFVRRCSEGIPDAASFFSQVFVALAAE
jgi:protein-S-isoprenylcysteine O-methyltransferase Ste14